MAELFISVDIETSGLDCFKHNILSIGAFTRVGKTPHEFYVELRPVEGKLVQQEALNANKLDIKSLSRYGYDPDVGLIRFLKWVVDLKVQEKVRDAIFVGFNAAFDWSFFLTYCREFNVENPFYYAPIDIKSMFFGLINVHWRDTTGPKIPLEFSPGAANIAHNAIEDATAQYFTFEKLRAERERLQKTSKKIDRQLEML